MASTRENSAARGTRKAGVRGRAVEGASPGEGFLLDEDALVAFEQRHPDGLSAAQIVDGFVAGGVHLSEATFRKWVQLGLLPRSRRVGRKGKHQGSMGIYPPETVRRIAAIKRRMSEGLTVEEIGRALRFRDEVGAIGRRLAELFRAFGDELEASRLSATERRVAARQLAALEKQGAELVERIGELERRVVEPFEREARARAFGSGTSGGAGDLL